MGKYMILAFICLGFWGCDSNDDHSEWDSETVTVQSLQNILIDEDWHIVEFRQDGLDLLPVYNAYELDFYNMMNVRAVLHQEVSEGNWNVYSSQTTNPNAQAILVLNFEEENLQRFNYDWMALTRNANRVRFQMVSGNGQLLDGFLTLERD